MICRILSVLLSPPVYLFVAMVVLCIVSRVSRVFLFHVISVCFLSPIPRLSGSCVVFEISTLVDPWLLIWWWFVRRPVAVVSFLKWL